mmetsp:Transcript_104092/g.321089  ORF Transcript_104092/g.321089 Transcript_104092/m.321089 type:complete len:266 (+) Transcript_104092:1590-2387(+)
MQAAGRGRRLPSALPPPQPGSSSSRAGPVLGAAPRSGTAGELRRCAQGRALERSRARGTAGGPRHSVDHFAPAAASSGRPRVLEEGRSRRAPTECSCGLPTWGRTEPTSLSGPGRRRVCRPPEASSAALHRARPNRGGPPPAGGSRGASGLWRPGPKYVRWRRARLRRRRKPTASGARAEAAPDRAAARESGMSRTAGTRRAECWQPGSALAKACRSPRGPQGLRSDDWQLQAVRPRLPQWTGAARTWLSTGLAHSTVRPLPAAA